MFGDKTFFVRVALNSETEDIKEFNMYLNDLSAIQKLNCKYSYLTEGAAWG